MPPPPASFYQAALSNSRLFSGPGAGGDFLMRYGGGSFFAERLQVRKAVQRKGPEHLRRPAGGDKLCQPIPRRRAGLEAVGAPADIEQKSFNLLHGSHDWGEIGRHVAQS